MKTGEWESRGPWTTPFPTVRSDGAFDRDGGFVCGSPFRFVFLPRQGPPRSTTQGPTHEDTGVTSTKTWDPVTLLTPQVVLPVPVVSIPPFQSPSRVPVPSLRRSWHREVGRWVICKYPGRSGFGCLQRNWNKDGRDSSTCSAGGG